VDPGAAGACYPGVGQLARARTGGPADAVV